MSDRFTEVSTTGYFGRLGGSLLGMLIGFVLLLVAAVLLYWNEGRAVQAAQALDQGAKQVIEIQADTVDSSADGKLVHVTGALTIHAPAKDPVFGVSGPGLARLDRTVEMFQWVESQHSESHESVGGSKTTETTYTYEKQWSAEPVDSSRFRHPDGHENPAMPIRSETFNGDVGLGAYRLDPALLGELSAFQPLSADSASAVPPEYRPNGGGFYRGYNPTNPAVGDLRIAFRAMEAQTVSVVGAETGGALASYTGMGGFKIALAETGVVPAAEMFHEKKQAEGNLTWILRGVGFVVMMVALMLIARPVATVLAFLPFLEGIAEAGIFLIALTVAVPLTLVTIAVAWIAHRPLLGVLLILAAIGSFVLFHRLHPKPAAKTAVAAG